MQIRAVHIKTELESQHGEAATSIIAVEAKVSEAETAKREVEAELKAAVEQKSKLLEENEATKNKLATASQIALQTEIPSIKGGSPTALEWKMVASMLGLSGNNSTLNSAGVSPIAGIL